MSDFNIKREAIVNLNKCQFVVGWQNAHIWRNLVPFGEDQKHLGKTTIQSREIKIEKKQRQRYRGEIENAELRGECNSIRRRPHGESQYLRKGQGRRKHHKEVRGDGKHRKYGAEDRKITVTRTF